MIYFMSKMRRSTTRRQPLQKNGRISITLADTKAPSDSGTQKPSSHRNFILPQDQVKEVETIDFDTLPPSAPGSPVREIAQVKAIQDDSLGCGCAPSGSNGAPVTAPSSSGISVTIDGVPLATNAPLSLFPVISGVTSDIPVQRICAQKRYFVSSETSAVNYEGYPLEVIPLTNRNILKDVPFQAVLQQNGVPVRTIFMTLSGDSLPLIISSCENCPCPSGYVCSETTKDCVRKVTDVCLPNSPCSGKCPGYCAQSGSICEKSGDIYRCVNKSANIWVYIVSAVVFALLIAVSIFFITRANSRRRSDVGARRSWTYNISEE